MSQLIMKVDDINLVKVSGGGLSASVLNYLSSAIKTVFEVGQSFGGAIRRIASKNICPI